MKSVLLFLLSALALFSCNNDKAPDVAVEPTDSTEVPSSVFSWQATLNDSTGKMEMVKQDFTGPDSLTARGVTEFLNISHANVQLSYLRTSNDTIYLLIPDALFLTQQMGSTGPSMYFASAIYNYTEIPGINYVSVDFEEGDHASPGVFTRETFTNQ